MIENQPCIFEDSAATRTLREMASLVQTNLLAPRRTGALKGDSK